MASAPTDEIGKSHGSLKYKRVARRVIGERAWLLLCFACALLSVCTTFAILLFLVRENIPFFRHVTLSEFFFGTKWAPLIRPESFGILPLVGGTMMIALGAGLFAIPMGLLAAIYLSEYANERTRSILKPALELLAGVPTVVYGYFGLMTITPILKGIFGDRVEIYNAASGAIVVGVMILPLVASLCEDALTAVPKALREGAYGLGSTKFEVVSRVVVPGALSGVMSAFILAISRAVGETMAVTLAAGMSPKLTLDFGQSIQTMTAYIVQVSKGDTPAGSQAYYSIFAVGLTLFAITFAMNMVARALVKRYRRKYD